MVRKFVVSITNCLIPPSTGGNVTAEHHGSDKNFSTRQPILHNTANAGFRRELLVRVPCSERADWNWIRFQV